MKGSKKKTGYKMETKATDQQLKNREILYKLFQDRPMSDEELLICPGLFMRSSALAKILFVNEAYQLILNQPGVIVEFGTWWGQNLILFENLRAIYEPFNQSRRIIGFDTFTGYPKISKKDKKSETIKVGGYNVSKNYEKYLSELLDYHEKNNVLGAIKKHELIKGDVSKTAPKYFKENEGVIISLAYFDMALYEPTKVAFNSIKPHLIPGSILMLDEFNNNQYPGETIAFKEVFKDKKYKVQLSKYVTDRTFIIFE
tara:strand:+ start:1544 stop:2314 length:771 start_codon:yes stop_codon:yes gene_type:complete